MNLFHITNCFNGFYECFGFCDCVEPANKHYFFFYYTVQYEHALTRTIKRCASIQVCYAESIHPMVHAFNVPRKREKHKATLTINNLKSTLENKSSYSHIVAVVFD